MNAKTQELLAQYEKWLKGEGLKPNLSWVDLSEANLSDWVDLSEANLSWANLSKANLSGANLSKANLSKANLSKANLSWVDLSKANLSWVDLSGANLFGANLSDKDVKYVKSFTQIVPNGELEVYKATFNSIATLIIPKQAKRINYMGSRKCRAEYAKVLSIETIEGKKLRQDTGRWKSDFVYKVGSIVRPDKFDDDIRNECSNGIHFFLTKQEAIRWMRES